jgi:hypothetical protein
VLAREVWAAGAQHAAQDERDDDGVVELAGDGDEVGDEVEWKREVADQRGEQELASAGDAFVAEQAAEDDEAVGDARPRASTIAGTGVWLRAGETDVVARRRGREDCFRFVEKQEPSTRWGVLLLVVRGERQRR